MIILMNRYVIISIKIDANFIDLDVTQSSFLLIRFCLFLHWHFYFNLFAVYIES